MTDRTRRIRARITYANVVATLALTVAVGTGGAYAATQLAKNSVGPKQLRKNAVGSKALRNGSVAPRDLSPKIQGRFVLRASVNSDGTLRAGRADVTRSDPNRYTVKFSRGVANCTHVASLTSYSATTDPQAGSATIAGVGADEVIVTTADATGTPVAGAFNLIVAC